MTFVKGQIPWNKGKKFGPHSDEAKLKNSLARIGEKNHFYGKKHTSESKQKISDAAKKREKPKPRIFTCKRCNLEKEGHFNTKYCNECVTASYKCSCSSECTTMIRATGDRKKGFTFPLYASQHCPRTFTCIRCNKEGEQKGWGKPKIICDACLNKRSPCQDGCGKFVRAGYRDCQFISGHNTNLIPHEELSLRSIKGKKTMKKNGIPFCTPESAEKISKTVSRLHKEGKMKNTHSNRHSKGELSLKPYLEPLGYIHEGDKGLSISNGFRTRYPDYYNPETKQIVEYFGTYWHRDRKLKKGKKHTTEQETIDWYAKLGWSCVVIWEHETDEFIGYIKEELASANLGDF